MAILYIVHASNNFVTLSERSKIWKFLVTVTTNCQASTRYVKVSYAVGYEVASRLSLCRVYSVSTDIIVAYRPVTKR
jgi:hypothetical protein